MCHYNRLLMGHFEFLHDSRKICVPLNISKKLHWQHLLGKLGDAETITTFIAVNANEKHRPFKQTGSSSLVHGHVLVYSVDKTHVLIVTVESIWLFLLNIPSFSFAQTSIKSIRLRRLRRRHAKPPCFRFNQPLSKFHCFFAWCAVFKVATSFCFFFQLFLPIDSAFA